MKYNYFYITISTHAVPDDTNVMTGKLLNLLAAGAEIVSAISADESVHYILRQELPGEPILGDKS